MNFAAPRLDASALLSRVSPAMSIRRWERPGHAGYAELLGGNERWVEARNGGAAPCRTSSLARAAGVSPRSVQRWLRYGIPYWTADQVAVALGCHPSEVWPEWYQIELRDEADDAFAQLRAWCTNG